MKKAILLTIIILFVGSVSASLGITPAKQEINFIPGQQYEFTFTILSDDPVKEIDLYLAGDLAEYGKLSKDQIIGTESFKVSIFLPESIEPPGKHDIIVRGKERIEETSFIGTRIDIGAPIKIFVPYPGKYAELQLNIPNGNAGEEIPVELKIVNRGRELLAFDSVYIDFYTNDKKVSTLSYKPAQLDVGEERYFRKMLSTLNYKAGDYTAFAHAVSSQIFSANHSFRIGSLYVNITNFTERLPQKGIEKFYIGVESFWNKNLEGIFAEVNLTKDGQQIIFRTPPIDLKGWEQKFLEGFIGTEPLEGTYSTKIILYYAGQTTTANGTFVVYKYSYVVIVIVGLIVMIIIGATVFLLLKIKTRKVKGENNMRKISYFIFGFSAFLLLISISAYIYFTFPLQEKTLYASFNITGQIGVDVNGSALTFGETSIYGTSSRDVNFYNSYDFPVILDISTNGKITPLLYFEKESAILPHEQKKISFIANAGENSGFYDGIVKFKVYPLRNIRV